MKNQLIILLVSLLIALVYTEVFSGNDFLQEMQGLPAYATHNPNVTSNPNITTSNVTTTMASSSTLLRVNVLMNVLVCLALAFFYL